jgi:excinuclease UvrABC ATPase subunit
LSRPDVDDILNLSTSIVIDKKRMGNNLRSTVGTATEINTCLRLLFSRVGKPFAMRAKGNGIMQMKLPRGVSDGMVLPG